MAQNRHLAILVDTLFKNLRSDSRGNAFVILRNSAIVKNKQLPEIDYTCFPETEEEVDQIVLQDPGKPETDFQKGKKCKLFLKHVLKMKSEGRANAVNRWVCSPVDVGDLRYRQVYDYRYNKQETGRMIPIYKEQRSGRRLVRDTLFYSFFKK